MPQVYNCNMRLFRRDGYGIWYVEFGRGKKRSLRTTDEQVAKRRFKAMEGELLAGKLLVFGQKSTLKLSELFDEYREWGALHLSTDSQEIFEYRGKLFLEAVGDKIISSIAYKDMESVIKKCKARGMVLIT
jgi:hypothetical protein